MEKTILRVASYNILVEGYAKQMKPVLQNISWEARKEQLIQRLKNLKAHILCLQEVDRYQDLSKSLEKEGYKGIFNQRNNGTEEGCAIFYHELQFKFLDQHVHYFNDGTGRLIMHLRMQSVSRAKAFNLFNTHLIPDPEINRQEVASLKQVIHQASGACMLCGDFNFTPRHPLIKELELEGWQDALINCSKGSFLVDLRPVRYDFILFKNMKLLFADVMGDPLNVISANDPSDHLPLIADFELANE